jgi:hypothetical protein
MQGLADFGEVWASGDRGSGFAAGYLYDRVFVFDGGGHQERAGRNACRAKLLVNRVIVVRADVADDVALFVRDDME